MNHNYELKWNVQIVCDVDGKKLDTDIYIYKWYILNKWLFITSKDEQIFEHLEFYLIAQCTKSQGLSFLKIFIKQHSIYIYLPIHCDTLYILCVI